MEKALCCELAEEEEWVVLIAVSWVKVAVLRVEIVVSWMGVVVSQAEWVRERRLEIAVLSRHQIV